MDLVSIIIPVYNGEKCMRKAIKSALGQTYKHIEVIIVNDGSTDGSLQIAEEYRSRDDRIIILSQPNGGLAAARNTGLSAAKGKYIQFLDCDDTLRHDAIEVSERILRANPNAGFLMFGLNGYWGENLLRSLIPEDGIFNSGDGYAAFQKYQNLLISACNKFYKAGYIQKHFDDNLIFGVDYIFNYRNLTDKTTFRSC